jgi:uncharacterized membrane protein
MIKTIIILFKKKKIDRRNKKKKKKKKRLLAVFFFVLLLEIFLFLEFVQWRESGNNVGSHCSFACAFT